MSHHCFQLEGIDHIQFPISRERLANIRKECNDLQIETYIKLTVDNMTTSIIKEAYAGRKSVDLFLYGPLAVDREPRSILSKYVHADKYFPDIMKKLKERFPDCNIVSDTLERYIKVSW